MSKARQLADLLDSNGDVVVGALDNAPDPDLTPYATNTALSTTNTNLSTNYYDKTEVDTKVSGVVTKTNTDPTLSTNGSVGDIWANTSTGDVYICTDATTNNNTWKNLGLGRLNVEPPEFVAGSGGSVTTSGNYKTHVFTTAGTFTVTNTGNETGATTLEVLLVGGGGGTGFTSNQGGNGGESKIIYPDGTTVTAVGGGGGGTIGFNGNSFIQGKDGGCGGGAGRNENGTAFAGAATATSSGVPFWEAFGFEGGDATGGGSSAGGGGGGANGAGDNGTSDNAGRKGGSGKYFANFPNWGTNATNTTSGTRGYFAGGGGSGGNTEGSSRGSWGGGHGLGSSTSDNRTSGQANTGGGGGGSGSRRAGGGGAGAVLHGQDLNAITGNYTISVGGAGSGTGANGGSGIVLIRYKYQ